MKTDLPTHKIMSAIHFIGEYDETKKNAADIAQLIRQLHSLFSQRESDNHELD